MENNNELKESPSDRAKRIFDMIAKKNAKFLKENYQKKEKIICNHYKTDHHIYTKCCRKIYPCRLCHDENEDHSIYRYNIKQMFCSFCNCIQKVNSHCINPECYIYKKKSKY